MLVLSGKRIELREITAENLPLLFAWRNSKDFLDLCTSRQASPTLEAFRQELERDFSIDRYAQFMIRRRDRAVGTIYVYGMNQRDGHAFITTYIAPNENSKGAGVLAFTMLAHYLFVHHNLYKVYADVYAHNIHSMRCFEAKHQFIVEGRFKGHSLFRGTRYDLVRFALFRQSLPELSAFIERAV